MTGPTTDDLRIAVLTSLVDRAERPLGRTALMKCAYLLQAARNVPLRYRFHLYNYGPYVDALLADVRRAQALGLVSSKLLTFPSGGYGYEFTTGEAFESSKTEIAAAVGQYSDEIDWVLENFGYESASRLELISTLVFAMCEKRRRLDRPELIQKVHEIKPHFSTSTIEQTYDEISEVLNCVTCHDDE
jgi:uncharacterized protein YwgA